MKRTQLLAGALTAGLLTVSACGPSAQDLPLPGSSQPGETYEVTATFDDALNLADGAPVKVNGLPIGRVSEITVKDFQAVVTMDIAKEQKISKGADFRLRATTVLGELFVDIVEDPAATGELKDGAAVADDFTDSAPTVEDTLSAASMFVNGGGLGQIQTIVDEANLVVGGREDVIRDLLHRLTSTTMSVNAMSGDIDAALTAINEASLVIDSRQDTINRALTEIRPAAAVLQENTDELVTLLTSVSDFSGVLIPTIDATRDDIQAIVAEAGPIFAEVAATAPRLDAGVQQVLGFVEKLDNAGVPGYYLNTYLHLDVSSLTEEGALGDGGIAGLEITESLVPILQAILLAGGDLSAIFNSASVASGTGDTTPLPAAQPEAASADPSVPDAGQESSSSGLTDLFGTVLGGSQ
ncbi:MAG: MlaD family protein [Aeromicrobium sp.]|uniref:MCE family protein n=1 Tax=Aeromicrobium sp. TaxID=1871063 RepID=UPI0039E47141